MRTVLQAALAIFTVVGLCGCGTVQDTYKPSHLGNLGDGESAKSIQVTLKPDKYRARKGDPVTFTVVIKNTGDQSVWFPRDPDLLLTWVYPDGRRDNLVRSEEASGSKEEVLLKPGQDRIEHSVVTTYYFNRSGIHEFRAIVSSDTDEAASKKSWTGRAVSNGFGIYFSEN